MIFIKKSVFFKKHCCAHSRSAGADTNGFVHLKHALHFIFLGNMVRIHWEGVLAIMAYTGKLCPAGVPFSGFSYFKG